MEFTTQLIKGSFIKRYKRFFVDAKLENGETVVTHCPNTGSMKGLIIEGAPVYLTPNDDPKRKLKYTFEMIDAGTSLVGVNTSLPNKVVEEGVEKDLIPALLGYSNIRREVKYGENSRIDLLLEAEGKPKCYVEVKNTTLAEGKTALFPDSVTSRGTKHLLELAEMVKQGHRSVMVFLCNRADCEEFSVADEIDKVYGETFRSVLKEGVEAVCMKVRISPNEIIIDKEIPIKV
jgi:sugar fermentation stimulation protein A